MAETLIPTPRRLTPLAIDLDSSLIVIAALKAYSSNIECKDPEFVKSLASEIEKIKDMNQDVNLLFRFTLEGYEALRECVDTPAPPQGA